MIDENKVLIQEVKKEKQKLSDERVEYNRQIRQEARKESYVDMVKRIICENVEPITFSSCSCSFINNHESDLLCHLTDIHAGIDIVNWYVSELISAMLEELSHYFENIYVYTTPGNHSRISPKKEDALDGENMDLLLPFYIKARLQNISNIHICNNEYDPEIAIFDIRGNIIMASHGHKDSPSSVVQNFTLMFGKKPDIVLLGHRHLNGLTTVYDTKVIESGCVSGTDQYAVSIRKVNRPEQTISVINQNGLECIYDVQLD